MAERMTYVIRNIVRRFIFCNDEAAVWASQQIRILSWLVLSFWPWRCFREVLFVIKEKNFDGKGARRNFPEGIRQSPCTVFEVGDQSPAFYFAGIGEQKKVFGRYFEPLGFLGMNRRNSKEQHQQRQGNYAVSHLLNCSAEAFTGLKLDCRMKMLRADM